MSQIRVKVLSCHDLVRSDGFSNSSAADPYVVIGKVDSDSGERIKMNQTDVVKRTINPEFPENSTTFDLADPEQVVYFDVYDEDPGCDEKTCGLKITIGELVSESKTQPKATFPLKKKGAYKMQSCKPTIDLYIYPPEN